MKISMYEASIPTFLHTLRALKAILEKGVTHAETRKYEPTLLATTRLAPDTPQKSPFARKSENAGANPR